MCEFADRLTRAAGGTNEGDIRKLRGAGLDDREILDLVQVIAYFCYVNRIAGALGVPLEPGGGGRTEQA